MQEQWDVIVLGAGGAGMMCAATAARRGRRTLALDHADKLGKKILISGGGRCNFTNTGAGPHAYFSENSHFAKSAMARFTPANFVSLVEKHGISYYEKKLGQLFCHDSAQSIVSLLREECDEAGAEIRLNTKILGVEKIEEGGFRFRLNTSSGEMLTESLVIATGGLSIPKIGATDFGYQIAEQFGLEITRRDPALVSLTMADSFLGRFGGLSGASLDAEVSCNGKKFRENILFTHTGFSGPAILQVSLHWFPGDEIVINLSPDSSLLDFFMERKKAGSQKEVRTLLSERFTARIGEKLAEEFSAPSTPIVQVSDLKLRELAAGLHAWKLVPVGTGGYGKAEVTRGGLNTNELSSRTLEAKKVPGLFFIGEVVDVTGWLGGYNFQWAWASGNAAGESA
ncbi:MAG: NAD(P)/FAD-dependent oxidoreductase [Bacteriovoracia bacterium]